MENFSPVFSHHGKKFSTVWKTTGGGDVGEAVEAEKPAACYSVIIISE
jgi:hypothetical protein